MSEKRDVNVFIHDIFESIEKINGYVLGISDGKSLKKDKKTYDAVMMNFIIIGEAVKNMYGEVRESYPNVEWKQIMAMRNLLAHEYWGVDEEVVWSAIKRDLPELKKIVEQIVSSL